MSGDKTDVVESKVDHPAEAAVDDAPAEAVPAAESADAAPASEAAVAEAAVAEVPVAEVAVAERKASRSPVAVLAGVSAVLLVAAVVFGVLFAQERSNRQEAERDLKAQTALAAQRETDLAALQAQRAEIERKLATAEAQLLSPEAKAAISTCVKAYAEMERVVESIIANGPPVVSGADSRVIVTRTGGEPVSVSCRDAEPYLAKLG